MKPNIPSGCATVSSIAAKIRCSAHPLQECVKKAEVDTGIGIIPPAKVEQQYYVMLEVPAMAHNLNPTISGKASVVHVLLKGKLIALNLEAEPYHSVTGILEHSRSPNSD